MGKVLLSHSLVTSSFKDPDHQKDHDHDVDNPHDDFGYDYGVEVTTKQKSTLIDTNPNNGIQYNHTNFEPSRNFEPNPNFD